MQKKSETLPGSIGGLGVYQVEDMSVFFYYLTQFNLISTMPLRSKSDVRQLVFKQACAASTCLCQMLAIFHPTPKSILDD